MLCRLSDSRHNMNLDVAGSRCTWVAWKGHQCVVHLILNVFNIADGPIGARDTALEADIRREAYKVV